MADAPVRIEREITVAATPDAVFAVLADHVGWTRWFDGMTRVRVDDAAEGTGALRTVWVAHTRVQEHFVVWEPGERLVFDIVNASVPGMRAMTEDWRLSPSGTGATSLHITIAVEPSRLLRRVPGLVRWALARSTKGADGLTRTFPRGASGSVN
jgi:uncharacterized protein YndB with AHSA1/START domain